jgi:serine/threonine protein kinase
MDPLFRIFQPQMASSVGPYHFVEPIGQGSFGEVWKVVHGFTGQPFACKVINIQVVRQDPHTYENFTNELRANSQIAHPGIARLFDVQCDHANIFLILELCPGGPLEDLVRSNNGLSEEQAQIAFVQIMRTIAYIHSQSYVHRDVTLKNILMAEDGSAKLTDFGLCKRRELSQLCTTKCGTFVYIAPEMLRYEQYDAFKVDIWSAGICLYSMVTNHLPWIIDDNTPADQVWELTGEQICSGNIIYDGTMSDELKDLLEHMLTVDPDERFTALDVLAHPWMQADGGEDLGGDPDPNLVSLVESLIQTMDRLAG